MLVAVADSRLGGHGGLSSADVRMTTSQLGEEAYVTSVAGELDLYRSPELEQQLSSVIESGGTRVIVDLTGASLVDSSALEVLISAAERLARSGGRLALVCDQAPIARSLQLTAAALPFTMERSLAEAIGQFFGTLEQ